MISMNQTKDPRMSETQSKEKVSHLRYVSVFSVSKMDCSSEERMIRLALDNIDAQIILETDLSARKIKVFHGDNTEHIEKSLEALGLGAKREKTDRVSDDNLSLAFASEQEKNEKESGVLKVLLLINAVMFGLEFVVGWWAQSTGLLADSLDMFSDAAVYGVSLYAVGHSVKKKLKAAHLSGWLQVILALLTLGEVLRRFLLGSEPVSGLMMAFGGIALIANTYCLVLITKSRDSGAHMKASWIFSANDVIANAGVILAGFLVYLTGSFYPDLIIGVLIGLVVLNGARRILKLKS